MMEPLQHINVDQHGMQLNQVNFYHRKLEIDLHNYIFFIVL